MARPEIMTGCRLPKINEKSQNGKCETHTLSGGDGLLFFAWPIAWGVKVLWELAYLPKLMGESGSFAGH